MNQDHYTRARLTDRPPRIEPLGAFFVALVLACMAVVVTGLAVLLHALYATIAPLLAALGG